MKTLSLQATGINCANYLQIKLSISIFSTSSKRITGKCLQDERLQYPKEFSPCLSPKSQSWHCGKSFHDTYITFYSHDTTELNIPVEEWHIAAQHVRKNKKHPSKVGLTGNGLHSMFLSNVFTQILVNNVQAAMPAPRQTGDIFPQAFSQCCNKQPLNSL